MPQFYRSLSLFTLSAEYIHRVWSFSYYTIWLLTPSLRPQFIFLRTQEIPYRTVLQICSIQLAPHQQQELILQNLARRSLLLSSAKFPSRNFNLAPNYSQLAKIAHTHQPQISILQYVFLQIYTVHSSSNLALHLCPLIPFQCKLPSISAPIKVIKMHLQIQRPRLSAPPTGSTCSAYQAS